MYQNKQKKSVPFYMREIIYDEKKLYNYGINKISVRDYGRKELATKMARYQKDTSIIDGVLDKLESQGYLSDFRRARSLLLQFLNKESINKTKNRILQKGISEDTILEALNEINDERGLLVADESEYTPEVQKALRLIQNKFKKYDKDMWDKMTRFLAGRGFKYDDISKSIKAFSQIEND